MSMQGIFLLSAVATTMVIAGATHAEGLKQVATISISGKPINSIGVIFIDQATGLGYLADRTNQSVHIFDTKTNQFVSSITGFVGVTKSGSTSGPNGIIAVNNSTELWVSDGDSTIKVVDLKTGKIAGTISTGGKKRANAMAYDPKTRVLIVANPNEEPPFLSLISTEAGHKILAKIPIEDAAESLERSAYHAPSGMFYTDVPMLRKDHAKGGLAQIDPKTGKLVKLHEIDHCSPHSIAVVSDSTIFLGCSAAPADSPTPGAALAVFDVATGQVVAYGAALGGSGDTVVNPKLGQYYHAANNAPGGPALNVIDIKTRKLIQKIPTSTGARSIGVSLANNQIYLATTAQGGQCGGCIMVFAPE